MQPIVLTNAFKRPRATRLMAGVTVSEYTNVYACIEEMISTINDEIGASPLILPSSFDKESMVQVLKQIDGIILPGAVSNIHPSHYGQEVSGQQQFDMQHDEMDIFLIQQAYKMGIPLLCICRSMQAMNIAFGGTLHQQIDGVSGIDHSCSNPCDGHDASPAYLHEVMVERGGVFISYFPTRRIPVNSMHEQAIDKLGAGLTVEARAADGVIEAISCLDAPSFFVGVQWHPEAMTKHPVSQKIFNAFRQEVQTHFKSRNEPAPRPGVFKIAQWQKPGLG